MTRHSSTHLDHGWSSNSLRRCKFAMKSADILADVKKLLQEQMQVHFNAPLGPATASGSACQPPHQPHHGPTQAVTYKWLARQYGLPANTAKQLLFVFFEQNRKLTKVRLPSWHRLGPRSHPALALNCRLWTNDC